MAKLTTRARKALPKKDLGVPAKAGSGKKGGFPMEDKKHARLAIGGATRSYDAGNISKATEERVKAKARRKLGIARKAK